MTNGLFDATNILAFKQGSFETHSRFCDALTEAADGADYYWSVISPNGRFLGVN